MKTKILSAAASATLTMGLVAFVASPPVPAAAIPVFDASNYAQNLLTAARALAQIDNQIRSLQNEAQVLLNMEKHLKRINFRELEALRRRLQEIDRLMGQAQGITFRAGELDERYRQLFPDSFDGVFARDQRLARARDQLDSAMAAFRHTMGVQNRIVDNVRSDAEALKAIVDRSQGAQGSLAAQQATNQLLALTAKQQLQIQTMMAAQFRSESIERARAGQIEREARESTKRFLGDGKAYTPR